MLGLATYVLFVALVEGCIHVTQKIQSYRLLVKQTVSVSWD